MSERTEFGAKRTTCACDNCKEYCRHMPGCLIPSDLARMIPTGTDPYKWAEEKLLASPGAFVLNTSSGDVFSIPTLVPKTKLDGSCIFLNEKEECTIHENAPFGCAFFDCADSDEQQRLMVPALTTIRDAPKKGDTLYAFLWAHLAYQGKMQRPAEELRAEMHKG